MTKKLIALLLCLAMLLSFAACSKTSTDNDTSDSQQTQEPAQQDDTQTEPDATGDEAQTAGGTIGWIMINLTNPFYVSAVQAAQEAADKLGYELVVKDCDGSLENEIDMIENFIEMKVDVICADFVNAEGLADACKKAADAGIPVISLFNEIDTGNNYSVAYDHYVGFKAVTIAVCEALDGKGQICVMQGGIGNWASDERTRGFEEAVANYPDIEVLSMQPCDWDPATGVSIGETWLTQYDHIDALMCMTDGVTPSLIEMVQASGRADEIMIAGNDGETAVLELMNTDDVNVAADALLSSLRGGYLAVLAADQLVQGKELDTVWIPVSLVVSDEVKAKLDASDADLSFVDVLTADEGLAIANNYMNEFDHYFD